MQLIYSCSFCVFINGFAYKSCDEAYAAAREFFKAQVGEHYPFMCYSWLLYPENKEILPSYANTYRFMSEYDIVDWGVNEGQDLWRLFDTEEKNPDKLPTDGSLRRCYVDHLKKRRCCGLGLRREAFIHGYLKPLYPARSSPVPHKHKSAPDRGALFLYEPITGRTQSQPGDWALCR